MEQTQRHGTEARTNGRPALRGLLLVQLVIGYEWFMSGLTKLVRGDFPGGLAEELREKSEGVSGWYRGFLDGAVIPHAQVFGYLIEITELAAGLALIVAATVWLAAWERLPDGGRVAVRLATAGAAVAGIVMSVNFHLANGSAQPWGIPGDSFDEAVDLDSLIVGIQLVLVAVSAGSLVSLRSRRRRERPLALPARDPVAGDQSTIGRNGGKAAVPERR